MTNDIFSRNPVEVKDGVFYFGSEHEGDQFTDEDIASWGKHFARRWSEKRELKEFESSTTWRDLCDHRAEQKLILDIACGPNLGLLPDIYACNPKIRAIAADGCPHIAEKWKSFFYENAPDADINFVSFNIADMPLNDDCIDIITSRIGFGSLRYAGDDQVLGINEAYRVLKPGGHVFAIESEFEDRVIVDKTFKLWGKQNWFRNDVLTWRERFEKAGFIVEHEEFVSRQGGGQDWELGEKALTFGLEIVTVTNAYVLKKPMGTV